MAVMIAICFSILTISAILIYQGFRGVKAEIMTSTQMTARYMSGSLNQGILSMLTPAKTTLDLISRAKITTATTFEERLESLPLLKEMLGVNTLTTAVYIGYDNGEFFLLRSLKDGTPNLTQPPPPDSFYLLQSVTLGTDGQLVGEFSFYNRDLVLLERRVMPEYKFDPRGRDWYKAGKKTTDLAITPPYMFFFAQKVGVSLSRQNYSGDSVVSMDIALDDLNSFLETLRITPTTEIAIIDQNSQVIAYPGANAPKIGEMRRLPTLDELNIPIFKHLAVPEFPKDMVVSVKADDASFWYAIVSPLPAFTGSNLRILIAIPADSLLGGAWLNMIEQGFMSLAIVIAVLLCGWYLGKQIVSPVRELTDQVKALEKFDFSMPIGVSTHLKEVQELGNVLGRMQNTINGFQKISLALNKEHDLELMMKTVLEQLLQIVRLQSGGIYLYDNQANALKIFVRQGDELSGEIILPKPDMSDEELTHYVQSTIGPDDIVTVLRNREQELIGVLCIVYDMIENVTQPDVFAAFIHRIAGSAAVAIETRQLILTQKALLDSMIKLMADAIDAKSQYTGGHCRRVPELAIMMMADIKNSPIEAFAEFSMTKAQQEEFRVAAWMHDCGKLTTPEYVVDKATKLETIYNRIHEVRTRFEVLHRDATIACFENIANGMNPTEAQALCQQEQEKLQDEFAFIARSNIGGEAMSDADIERVQKIGQTTWLRHFDNGLGLSRDERVRLGQSHETLPVVERLLADKQSHIIPWGERIPPVQAADPRNVWGFDMVLPQHMYNYGEIYNLSIGRGTLTAEERFKINEHIVQTICMLSSLPFPKSFSRVTEIAGNHHEKMDGTGYPRRIDGTKMSIPEKVMAVADILEALTAPDRPYKDGKTLSQALSILSKMARERHVDIDVFNMLLSSGVYMKYARQYLDPAQIDDVSIDDYLVT